MTDTPSDPPQHPTQPEPPPGQYPTQPGPPPDQYQPPPARYQPPPGQYPAAGSPGTGRRNGMGTAALVLGVVALVLVLLLLFSPLGAFLGLLAVIFGIVGIVRVNHREADNRGQAVTGLVTGGLALLLGIWFTVSVGVWFSTHVTDFDRFGQCMNDASGPSAREECARQLARDLE